MAELKVDKVYGNAIYDVAVQSDLAGIIEEDFKAVVKIFRESDELKAIFRSPAISKMEKISILKSLFEGKINEYLLNFMCILIEKRRFEGLESIAREYIRLKNEAERISSGIIYSTQPLTAEQLEKFEKQTSKLLRENVNLINEIDESIIGGVKILIDGKIIDASLRKSLEEMSMLLR